MGTVSHVNDSVERGSKWPKNRLLLLWTSTHESKGPSEQSRPPGPKTAISASRCPQKMDAEFADFSVYVPIARITTLKSVRIHIAAKLHGSLSKKTDRFIFNRHSLIKFKSTMR